METGLLQIYTGDGKGKTTAAVGLAVRAAGAGLRVLFSQFLKGRPTGEIASLEKLGVDVVRSEAVTKFIPYMTPEELESCRRIQKETFDTVKNSAAEYDVVILDEVFAAMSTGMLEEDKIFEFVKNKPSGTEIVLTGRGAPERFTAIADYVSEIKAVKHPYDKGISARRGIEF